MNKAIFITFFSLLSSFSVYSQNVGINTVNPETTLDVNGDIRVRNLIRFGKSEGVQGSAGNLGDVLTSRGPGLTPTWAKPEESRTTYRLQESVVLIDQKGVYFDNVGLMNITPELIEDSDLSAADGWKEITALQAGITPTKSKNRIIITLQTMAQAYTKYPDFDALYAIGIFVDGKLKSTRPISVAGNGSTFDQGILYSALVDLPIKANQASYKIQVAVKQRYRNLYPSASSAHTIENIDWLSFVGTTTVGPYTSSTPVTNANAWMNKTSLKIELYEALLSD